MSGLPFNVKQLGRAVVFVAIAAALGLCAAAGGQAQETAGKRLLTTGAAEEGVRLTEIADGEIACELADGTLQRLAAEELVAWGRMPPIQGGPLVMLADGSLLVADPLSLRDEALRVYTRSLDEVRLPLEQVRGILYHVPHTSEELDRRLAALRAAEGDRDVLTLASGDELRGVVLDMDGENYTVESDAGRVEIAASRVDAVTFSPALVAEPVRPERPVLVGFRDGSYLTADTVSLADGRLELNCPGLPLLTTPRGVDAVEELSLVQPLAGEAVYLSDLEPHSYRHLPYLVGEWPLGIDENCLGGRLRTSGSVHAKGLGMHSASRVAFNLGGAYSQLEAELALDAAAGEGGSVIYRVFAGEAGAWEELYASPVVRGGDAPLAISVDVTGREQVLLVVDYADEADVLDRADWIDARVVP